MKINLLNAAGSVLTTVETDNPQAEIDFYGPQIGAVAWKAWKQSVDECRLETLAEIQRMLAATDYKTMKFIDGELTADEYAPIKTCRAALRAVYGKIEQATTTAKIKKIVEEVK